MRNGIFLISSLLVFAFFNYAIWQKEELKANGEIVLLELAPVDPRSLMQGDYMRLRYALEQSARYQEEKSRGYMVISPNADRVAKFVRFHGDEKLAPGEKLFHFHNDRYGAIRIVPDSFMFQEGHAQLYQRAKYGIFKFNASGNHILVGLADDQFRAIESKS